MLICQNCYAENADDVHVCCKCKIKGNQHFIYVANAQNAFNTEGVSATPLTIVTCWNCAKPAGDGEKCPHCHIKLKKKEAIKPIALKKATGGKATEQEVSPPSMDNVVAKKTAKKMP